MSHYIKNLIQEGEHQQLDFKYEISDSQKIARSLVAFANTDGGRLLVGVKDNGMISGVKSSEEYYMVETAATLYTKPEVPFTTRKWTVEGKTVVEVIVHPRHGKPHKAPDKEGKFKVFVRVKDQNLLANAVLLKYWQRKSQERPEGVFIHYTEKENLLLKYLEENGSITLSKLIKLTGLNKRKAEALLVDFMLLNIIEMTLTERSTFYTIKDM
ncbi:MAG: ATP-binding protein [Bacteroidetes bacterium]|nr:MAG: ATP-binding protein [Bacteroidota bacterium]